MQALAELQQKKNFNSNANFYSFDIGPALHRVGSIRVEWKWTFDLFIKPNEFRAKLARRVIQVQRDKLVARHTQMHTAHRVSVAFTHFSVKQSLTFLKCEHRFKFVSEWEKQQLKAISKLLEKIERLQQKPRRSRRKAEMKLMHKREITVNKLSRRPYKIWATYAGCVILFSFRFDQVALIPAVSGMFEASACHFLFSFLFFKKNSIY